MKKRNENHTFVICAYKDSPYLEECIKSIMNQTIESNVIISTSTPTDKVRGIADKYQIELFIHNEGGSIGKDWNYGFSIPKTKYVTIAHQDDVFLPTFLETNINKLEKFNNSIIAFTNYSEIDDKSSIIPRSKNLKIKDIMLIPFKMFKGSRFVRDRVFSFGDPICSPTITYNMSVLSDFRFSETVCGAIDWEALYRINKLGGRWIFTDKTLMYHRIHEGTETSNTIENNKRTKEEYDLFRNYWPECIVKLIMKQYSKAQLANSKVIKK